MLNWIKNINKEYPEFWKNYLAKFEEKSTRYVVMSAETTGLNPTKDVILSIGAVAVLKDNIVIKDSFEVVLLQYTFMHDHGLSNEFIIESKQPKLGEFDAIQTFVEYIGNAVLVGHRIHFVVDMINEVLEKHDCGRLRNQALDIEIMHKKLLDVTDKNFTLEELCKSYKIAREEQQSTSEDAFSVALLFLKLKSRLGLE